MEHGEGGVAAKREKLSAAAGGGEDRLSALPDDVLIQILVRLGTSGAVQTSVLSRRWRLLWYLLPEFDFSPEANGYSIGAALAAHEAPSLRHLLVFAKGTSPGTMAEWLPVAARRLSGDLFLYNMKPKKDSKEEDDDEEEVEERGAFLELPCFGSATSLSLDLRFLALAVPPSGEFARLNDLSLYSVRFHGPCELGDAISSPRFPSLKKLTIRNAQGLSNFIINSKSLLLIELKSLNGLQQLNVMAPALEVFNVLFCFIDASSRRQPVANISAPKLEILQWCDAFDPSSVQFGKMANLQWLGACYFLVYGQEDSPHNRNCLRLLQRFQFDAIPISQSYPHACLYAGEFNSSPVWSYDIMLASLKRALPTIIYSSFNEINKAIKEDIIDHEYLMEDMTVLPEILFLNLTVLANGHCIGPSLFHVLRMCTGVRRLKLELHISHKVEAEAECESDCSCDLPPNWRTDQLGLNFLHEVKITNLRGTEHEVALVKRLFSWATVLKEMTIHFYYSITESTAKELCKKLLSFCRRNTHEILCLRRLCRVLYVPEE